MGSNVSKTSNDAAAQAQKNDKDIGGNNPDPRSPTPEITRTPLQNKSGSKHNITKNVDLRSSFEDSKGETKLIHNNPILSAVIKNHLQSFDPRSPTQEFERTPIVITSRGNDSEIESKAVKNINIQGTPNVIHEDIHNNNDDISHKIIPELIPKNLCSEFYDLSLNDSLNDEPPLGSSTASNEAIIEHNGSESQKPTKLLETNFDYVEEEEDETGEEKLNCAKSEDAYKNIPLFKILNIDPRSPSVGIDRTPIVVAKTDDNSLEHSMEEMSDDLLMKALQTTDEEIESKEDHKNTDGIEIYEDDMSDTPKKTKSASNSGSRTPLSCMKNKSESNHGRSKSANTLYDPKKSICKIPKRASHIPRLKSLTKQTKFITKGSSISLKNSSVSGDCENTPPHSHRDKWDKESSIVL